MKKRMLSLALSLSLAVSLFVPAFAAEDTAPMEPPGAVETAGPSEDGPTGAEALYETEIWAFAQQYKENHPEEWTAFDADAWYEQEWSDFFASKEEYMEYYDLPSEEEFREDLWVEYVVDAAYEEYEDF